MLQGFFLGMLLPMMAVGPAYIDSPLRLCNAYLQDDQIRLGRWLIGLAALLALAWLAHGLAPGAARRGHADDRRAPGAGIRRNSTMKYGLCALLSTSANSYKKRSATPSE